MTTRSWEDYLATAVAPAGTSDQRLFDWARSGDLEIFEAASPTREQINAHNEKGHSVLMLASYNGHYELAWWLIQQGADVNSFDKSGSSILMGVAFKGYDELVHLLIQNGADPAHRNDVGQDALQFAEMFGRKNTARLLNVYLDRQVPARHSWWGARLRGWAKFFYQSLPSFLKRVVGVSQQTHQ